MSSTSKTVKNRDLFENMPVAKAVRTMAIPTIIGQLIILIYNMADTFSLMAADILTVTLSLLVHRRFVKKILPTL